MAKSKKNKLAHRKNVAYDRNRHISRLSNSNLFKEILRFSDFIDRYPNNIHEMYPEYLSALKLERANRIKRIKVKSDAK